MKLTVIQIFKQLFFIAIISICASLTAFAQKDNGDKTPPKPKPPVVVVKPKDPPPKDDKKDGDKPKKPQASIDGALQLVGIVFD